MEDQQADNAEAANKYAQEKRKMQRRLDKMDKRLLEV